MDFESQKAAAGLRLIFASHLIHDHGRPGDKLEVAGERKARVDPELYPRQMAPQVTHP